MRTRLVVATLTAAALALTMGGADAAPKTLDGKKVKVLTLKAVGSPQANDADLVALDGPERVACKAPRCARMEFIYKPARGVKGDVLFEAKWTNPAADIDLYAVEILKDGSAADLGHCGTFAGTTERVFLSKSAFKPGKKYAVIVDFYRTVNESVTATVTMPATNPIKSTAPSEVDEIQPINCGG